MLIWKKIQQINFTGNPDWPEDVTTFFIIEEAKETNLHYSNGAIKVLLNNFTLI